MSDTAEPTVHVRHPRNGRRKKKAKPMPESVKRELAERRKRKQAEDTENRVAKMAAGKANDNHWRHDTLHRYIRKVLSMSGLERLEWMDKHPISEIFR